MAEMDSRVGPGAYSDTAPQLAQVLCIRVSSQVRLPSPQEWQGV